MPIRHVVVAARELHYGVISYGTCTIKQSIMQSIYGAFSPRDKCVWASNHFRPRHAGAHSSARCQMRLSFHQLLKQNNKCKLDCVCCARRAQTSDNAKISSKSDTRLESDFRINPDPDVCRIAPRVDSFSCRLSYFAKHGKNRPMPVLEMLLNFLKSPIPQW